MLRNITVGLKIINAVFYLKTIVFILAYMFISSYAVADTLEVEYSSFYSHVKKLDNPETDALRFSFGFQHIAKNRLCVINNAQIVTQKKVLPLIIENNNRFTVPTDKILKMAKAKVVIDLDDQANQCDMSVQLETLPSFLKRQYSQPELLFMFAQYQAFFSKMGGFLSFMMPSVEGLLLHSDANVDWPKPLQALVNEKGALALELKWLEQEEGLELPFIPLRITAIVKK